MSKPKLTVAVTGLNAIDSPGPGVGVMRALRDCPDYDWRIIGLSYESLEPGIYMRDLVDKVYQIPYPTAGSEQLLNRLAFIHQKEKLQVIVPNFDAELRNFIRISRDLESMDIRMALPSMEQLERIDKINLFDFGEEAGFEVPKTAYFHDIHKAEELERDFDYPMVVKGKYYEAFVARNRGQLEMYYHKISAKWGLPVLVQKFVKGTEVCIAGLGDGQGNLLGAVPMRKLFITDKGKGWAGVSLDDPEYLALAEKFVQASHWKGGFEIELMASEDGHYYLMEINPRMPAWIYMAAAAGQNIPAGVVKLAMNEHPPKFPPYQVGKLFVRYAWDLVTDISDFEQISTKGEF